MSGKNSNRPASVWTEEELLEGRRVPCLAVVLRTIGCSWWRDSGGCSMCGYNAAASDPSVDEKAILRQFERAWESFDGHSILKIYTSGSFLDDGEIPASVREFMLERASDAGAKILFESRPEYVTPERMNRCVDLCPDLELALGLESANDEILSKSINKGFSFDDYRRAAGIAIDSGATIRTYLMLKPPFLMEEEAISDILKSIPRALEFSRVISINPVNVQRRTRVERLWNQWAFRPPWLWSVVDSLRRAEVGDTMLISSLVGAGGKRGPHNCGSCDDRVVAAIDGFNLTQDRRKLEDLDCACRERWIHILSAEKFCISAGDHENFFTRNI